jgi:RNA polymerase sigma-70 factor (ECF subfamily)
MSDRRSVAESDEALARRAQDGDDRAFETLVRRYAAQARRVAQSILGVPEDADDAAQEGLLAAWRHLDRYDPARAFRPWFLRIVVNAATDLYRRRRVRTAEPLRDTERGRTAGPDRETDRALLRDRIGRALAELSDRQRVAVTMFDLEGYSHAEIAAVLQVPEGTVRSLVFHGRRNLRRALALYQGEGT